MPLSGGEYRKWTRTDGVTEFFLCSICKRVAAISEEGLVPRPSMYGLWPDHEDAPLRVFEVPIECDALRCKAQATVFVARSRETTDEALKQESKKWILADLKCPDGHQFPWPP